MGEARRNLFEARRPTWHFLEGIVRPLARSGRTLLLVTHHVDDIVPEVDRVVLLSEGRIVADGPKAEMLTAERLSALYGSSAEIEGHDGWYRLWWKEPEGTSIWT